MAPELPFIGAGLIALVTGVRREGGFPANGIRMLVALSVLVIVATATSGTKLSPLIRALGVVLLITSLIAFGQTLNMPKPVKGVAQAKENNNG